MIKVDSVKLRAHLDAMHEEANARDLRSENIRKIVGTARKDGLDGKALRKVFVRERMEPEKRKHDDETLSLYESALGGKGAALKAVERGEKVGRAAEANGIHRSTVARARHVAKQVSNATPSHAPETGVIIEDAAPQLASSCVHLQAPQPLSEGGDGIGHQSESCGVAEPGAPRPASHSGTSNGESPSVMSVAPDPQEPVHAAAYERPRSPTPSVGAVAEPSAAQRVAPEIVDDLKIPHFLLRAPA